MRNFKVVMLALLIAMLVLVACQPAPTPAPDASTGSAAPTTATETTSANPVDAANPGCLGSAASAVVDLNCRTITIAVENAYLPFNYIEIASGQPGGWDYDTWTELCTLLHCAPVFKETGWDGLIQSVSDGLYDVGADGLTILPDRQKIVDFSDGYLQINQRLLVRAGETRFDSLEALAKDPNFTVGTQSGTSNYETTIKYVPAERVKAFEQMPFAIQSLLSKDVDAVVIDEVAGLGYQGQDQDKLAFVGPSMSSDQLAFIFPKGSDLVEPVNKAIAALKANGVLDKINAKFFGP
ncbi:MAG TPA: transporter substrate-binding domain-containing protein, partial [Anaerolineaceae bacterium]|nr:transporter substrate-binding domain-containing protein [Anaerolineaceae bacterium]